MQPSFLRNLSIHLVLVAILAGCAADLRARADAKAIPLGFQHTRVQTDDFLLTTYTKITDANQPVDVYIEGDGLAWLSRTEVSPNPTPHKAMALSLATLDPAANIIYIARPCQFTPLDMDVRCSEEYWTKRRYSEEVIASVNQAIDKLTNSRAKPGLHIIGYSGGAAVAVLIAARRNDVISIRTIAGNLDHEEVSRQHEVTALSCSLNPIDQASRVAAIPQRHFSGNEDTVISAAIGQKFKKASGNSGCVHLQSIEGATHEDGWLERWPMLIREPVKCQ